MASWMLILSCSLMLLNSSMQHRPPSARTRAPASRCQSTPSFTAVTVSPAEEIPSLVEPIQNTNITVCTTRMEEMPDRRAGRSQQWSQISEPATWLNVCVISDLKSELLDPCNNRSLSYDLRVTITNSVHFFQWHPKARFLSFFR